MGNYLRNLFGNYLFLSNWRSARDTTNHDGRDRERTNANSHQKEESELSGAINTPQLTRKTLRPRTTKKDNQIIEDIRLLRETNTANITELRSSIRELQLQLQNQSMMSYFILLFVVVAILAVAGIMAAAFLLRPCCYTTESHLELQWHGTITEQLRVIEKRIEDSSHRK